MHVLVVEDDSTTLELISRYYEKENMRVYAFKETKGVIDTVKTKEVDLCVLDVMIGQDNGFDLLKEIKGIKDIPIIFVTAKSDEFDRIYGIEIGADDYLTKPFSPRELMARSKRLLKRLGPRNQTLDKPKSLVGGKVRIDLETMIVTDLGKVVSLTLKEYETLVYFLNNPNIVLSRDKVIEEVWGFDALGQTRMVDDIVKRLRKKLSIEVETVWGVGYRYYEKVE